MFVAVVYGVFVTAAPVLADNEFDGGGGRSDGAWGWNPPNHDRFGSGDGIGFGGGGFGADDDYGSGGGGPFGGGNGGQFAGQMGLFAFLISLLTGQTGLVGPQRERAGMGMMNLMQADASGSSGGSSNGSNGDDSARGRIQVPDNGQFFDAP